MSGSEIKRYSRWFISTCLVLILLLQPWSKAEAQRWINRSPCNPYAPNQTPAVQAPCNPNTPSQLPANQDTAQPPAPKEPVTQPVVPEAQAPSFSAEQAAATGGSEYAAAAPSVIGDGGYLDNPIPMNTFRLRYDAAFDINRPDRAEFIYGTWRELSFHPHGIKKDGSFQGVFFDPKAKGPTQLPTSLNSQELSAYMEAAYGNRLSAFVDLPERFLHFSKIQEENIETPAERRLFPERGENRNVNNNPTGFADMQAGFKYAILADPERYLTFQLRTYIPTGNAGTGLGTGHVSLEPSFLLYQHLSDKLVLQGQLATWVPINAGPEAGNILIYGLGLSYNLYKRNNFRITPVTEFVGWTVLNGFEAVAGSIPVPPGVRVPDDHGVVNASGDTIINAKIGVRTYFGERSDIYLGWGHCLTGDRWYQDIFRAEYRFRF